MNSTMNTFSVMLFCQFDKIDLTIFCKRWLEIETKQFLVLGEEKWLGWQDFLQYLNFLYIRFRFPV